MAKILVQEPLYHRLLPMFICNAYEGPPPHRSASPMNHRGLVSIEIQREAAPKDARRDKNFIGLYVQPMKAYFGAARLFCIVFHYHLAKGARGARKLHTS